MNNSSENSELKSKADSDLAWQEEKSSLISALKKAENDSKFKTDFLVKISHDLRTPMNAIIGMTSLALKNLEDTSLVREYLTKIDFSSNLLLGIINDILDISAIENKRIAIYDSKFDFRLLLSSLSTIYSKQCSDKNIKYAINLNHVTEEFLIGDRMRVNQILSSLLSNAVTNTESGGEISLSVTQLSKDGDLIPIRFSVSDSGCIMSELHIRDLLNSSFGEHALMERDECKFGLDLAICKNLVEMMGGKFTFKKSERVGSVFTAEIPFKLSKDSRLTSDNLADFRILLIGSDVKAREYVVSVFERVGVSYGIASSSDEALMLLLEAATMYKTYDLCIIDWTEPDIDAIALTRQIRKHCKKDVMPIVITTDKRVDDVSDAARFAGADKVILKPFYQSSVFNIITEFSGVQYKKLEAEGINYDFSGYKILLVEDNRLNAEISSELLTSVGFVVDCAENGLEAVEIYKKSKPGTYHIILMDLQMPIMNGYEAALAIRSCARYDSKFIPILALTADAFAEDIDAVKKSGMNAHLLKPINTKQLYQVLKEFLDYHPIDVTGDEYDGKNI